jgi:hypothetical protein
VAGDRLVKLDYDVMMAGVNIQLTTFTPVMISLFRKTFDFNDWNTLSKKTIFACGRSLLFSPG